MSDETTRRPLVFRVDQAQDPDGRAADREAREEREARAPRAVSDLSRLEIEPDDAIDREELEGLDPPPAVTRPRGFSFGKIFLSGLGLLFSLAVGLAVDGLVRELFQRADWLGWLGIVLTILVLVGAAGLICREAIGLMRLAAVDREREAGRRAFETDSQAEAQTVVRTLSALLAHRAETAAGRANLARHRDAVIDGRDLIGLAEQELLLPLDARARALVLGASKRVSVVTAVSPRAMIDLAFVLLETVRLIRQMSELYGARPGTLGLLKLTRDVLAHLAVTGSISIGDSLLQQVVGHGVAAKLSARFGEGVVNGLLTARVGLAAMDLCRPLPFLRVKRPTIGDFLSDIARFSKETKPGS